MKLLLGLDDYKKITGTDWKPHKHQGFLYHKQNIDKKLRAQVFERDGFKCKKCGSEKNLCADHIVPESKGGETTLENLQTLCKSCNAKKGARQ